LRGKGGVRGRRGRMWTGLPPVRLAGGTKEEAARCGRGAEGVGMRKAAIGGGVDGGNGLRRPSCGAHEYGH